MHDENVPINNVGGREGGRERKDQSMMMVGTLMRDG